MGGETCSLTPAADGTASGTLMVADPGVQIVRVTAVGGPIVLHWLDFSPI
jgi:hypothetical protein